MSEEDWTIVSKPVVANKWQDEEDEEVKDNWDDDDEDEDSKASSKSETTGQSDVPKPATAAKKKKGKLLKEKLAQKELNDQQRPKTHEELVAAKMEQMRLQQESDLEVAKDAFGIGSGIDASVLSSISLNTKKDFEDFSKALNDKLSAYTRSPHYIAFLETLFRDLSAGLEADNIKKLDNALTALFNEKIKAQKQTTKKKGKGIKNQEIKVEREDDYSYDQGGFDDYDDFI